MDQVTKVRRHIKREEWKSIVSECQVNDDSTEKSTVFKELEVTTPVENPKASVVIHLGGATNQSANNSSSIACTTRQMLDNITVAGSAFSFFH